MQQGRSNGEDGAMARTLACVRVVSLVGFGVRGEMD
jgi:hypothetical protein